MVLQLKRDGGEVVFPDGGFNRPEPQSGFATSGHRTPCVQHRRQRFNRPEPQSGFATMGIVSPFSNAGKMGEVSIGRSLKVVLQQTQKVSQRNSLSVRGFNRPEPQSGFATLLKRALGYEYTEVFQ